MQRLTLTGRGGGEGSVELTIPPEFCENALIVKVLSDGWRGVDVEKSISWKSDDQAEAKAGDKS